MEGAETPGRQPEVEGALSRWRIGAGALVLVAMVVVVILMLPPYVDNYRLQQRLDDIAARPDAMTLPEDVIRSEVANQAARLGLPLRNSQVRIIRTSDRVRLEVAYAVRVDLPLYTVDLHFHPAAGSR